MTDRLFTNSHILEWLNYFSENTDIDIEKVKILDITRKNKNLIPTVESHRCTLVFTEAGHPDIFYRMFNAGLGECTVIYNEGSNPAGEIKRSKVYDMINRGINSSAGMLILNENARSTFKFGMDNLSFATGSVKYVGSEIRAVILSKMQIDERKSICVISGESIAVESAMLAPEGTVIAVEYNERDRRTLEENVNQFGLQNITIIDRVDEESMKELPVPDVTMLVASASMENEMEYMLKINPEMEFVIYTLDFTVAAQMDKIFAKLGIGDADVTQITVAKLSSKHTFDVQPSPWLITRKMN